MQIGRCCTCEQRTAIVQLKGLASSTGTTQWEWGPGFAISKVYGSTEFVAIGYDNTATDNLSVMAQGFYLVYDAGTDSYNFNARYADDIELIDGTDGSSTTSGIDWLLVAHAQGTESYAFVVNAQLQNTDGLSTGNLVSRGNVAPTVVFNSRTNVSTTASKTYKLLPHTQRGGNVNFKTSKNAQTVSAAHNATASAVASAFAAVSDVSSASATGGPWPYSAINLSVTWAHSDGDIGEVSVDSTYVIQTTPTTVSRKTAAAAFVISASTGAIHSSIPHALGNGLGSSGDYLMPSALPSPSSTAPRTGELLSLAAAASGAIAAEGEFFPAGGTYQQTVEAWTESGGTWSQSWVKEVNTSPPGRIRSKNLHVENDAACVSVPFGNYNGTEACAAVVAMGTGTASYFTADNGNTGKWSITQLQTGSSSARWTYNSILQTTGPTNDYTPGAIEAVDGTNKLHFGINGPGFIFGTQSGTVFAMASRWTPTAADSTPVELWGITTRTFVDSITLASTAASVYRVRVYWPLGWRAGGSTEWRFVYRAGYFDIQTTGWLAWDATEAQIEAAIIALFGENTEGLYSNVNLWPLTVESPDNTAAAFEVGLDMQYLTSGDPSDPFGFIPAKYVLRRQNLRIETRYYQQPNTSSVCSFDASDGSVNWSRMYGTIGGQDAPFFARGWADGSSWVWLSGGAVDSDLLP